MRLHSVGLAFFVMAAPVPAGACAGQGQRQSQAAAAAGQSERPEELCPGSVRPKADADFLAGARNRLLCARLPRRRHRAADQRQDLAGDAAVPQPQLGPSRSGQDARASGRQGTEARLAGLTGRRHGAAARRADADRPHQPSGRARRRYLADADADTGTHGAGARGNVGDQCGRRRQARRRSGDLDAAASCHHPRRGGGSRRRTHHCQRGDQEGDVPGGGGHESLLAAQGAPVVRAQLSFPHPHCLSEGQPGMQAAGSDAGKRRLQRSRLLVPGQNFEPADAEIRRRPGRVSPWPNYRRPAGRCCWRLKST